MSLRFGIRRQLFISTTTPPPSPPLLVAVLGVLSCVAQPAPQCLIPVPPRHGTVRRFDDPPVSLSALLSRPLGHNTVSLLRTAEGSSVDPSVARKTLRSSARHWAQFFSGRPGPGFSPPQPSPQHHPAGQTLIGRPLYAPRKEEVGVSLADGCLNALALCLFEGLGVRREGVRALSALWKPMIRRRRSLWCAVRSSAKSAPLTKSSRHAPRTAESPSPRPFLACMCTYFKSERSILRIYHTVPV